MRDSYVANYETLETEHWWWRARRAIIWHEIKHLASTSRNLLEIGCGAGTNLAMAQSGFACIGVEPDADLRCSAAQKTGMAILDGSLPGDLPDFGKRFDVVLLLDVLEHVENDLEALRTIHRLLASFGLLVINVPAFPLLWSVHDEVNQHFRRYRLDTLSQVIENAGLRIHKINYWGSLLFPLAILQRKVLALRNAPADDYHVSLPRNTVNRAMEIATLIDSRFSPFKRLFGLSLLAVATKA